MLVPNRTSAAYDFALFESSERENESEEKNTRMRIRDAAARYSASRSGSIFKILLAAVCAVMLPIYYLSSKVESTELSGKINQMQIELEQELSNNLRLQAELDSIVTTSRVDDFAQNELGMQKITTAQGMHISLNTGGTTEIAADTGGAASAMSKLFSDVLEFLGIR
jgi:cell division protein FtsL